MTGMFLSTVWLSLANLSPGAVHRLEETNKKLADGLETWLRQREELRISLRLLHFAASILAVLCALSWLEYTEYRGVQGWLPVFVCLMLYVLTPEVVAYNLPRLFSWRVLNAAMPVIRAMNIMVYPVSLPLAGWHRFVLEKWKNGEENEEIATREDEIRSLIEQDESSELEQRELESDERRMIRGVFDLDETSVREIMTPRVDMDAVDETSTIGELKERIMEYGHSRVPVYHQSTDHIRGLVYAKDLIREDLDTTRSLAETPELLHAPTYIPESKNVGDLLTELQQNRTHFAIVIDEYGGTEGVVTMEDILEEIVGEIHDEYDEAEVALSLPEPNDDGSIDILGRTSIYELNQQYSLGLPEEKEYETVGGYVVALLGRIPQKGEGVETSAGTISVLDADRRRVLKVRIEPVSAPHAKDDYDSQEKTR